jgi:hypothetical protein
MAGAAAANAAAAAALSRNPFIVPSGGDERGTAGSQMSNATTIRRMTHPDLGGIRAPVRDGAADLVEAHQ